MSTQDGNEYAILHPHVDLAGLAMTARINKVAKSDKAGLMCGIFDSNRNNQQASSNQAGTGAPAAYDDDLNF